MEPEQQQQQQQGNEEEGGSNKGSFLCRQSSTRWTPTTDQIRILKELYYNNGVRSPSAEQIQRISARLRQYGKIEGKNVFYWFQNHKARERQKKRFTTCTDHNNIIHHPMQPRTTSTAPINAINGWRSDHQDPLYHKYPNFTNPPPGVPSPSSSSSSCSSSVIAVGNIGGYGYGSATMERSFRDCSISRGGCVGGGSIGHNYGWVGVDSYSTPYPFLDHRSTFDETLEEEQDDQLPEIETLPLFPMHAGDDIKPESDIYHNGNWYLSDDSSKATSRTSLELSLNSYPGR